MLSSLQQSTEWYQRVGPVETRQSGATSVRHPVVKYTHDKIVENFTYRESSLI